MSHATGRQYRREIRRQTGYEATWLPMVRVRPGDVGTLRGGEYNQIGTLRDFGIDFAVEEGHVKASFDYVSRGVSKRLGTAASRTTFQPDLGSASVTVTFARADAILFSAVGCRSSRLTAQQEAGRKVIDLYRRDLWLPDYAVVTESVSAAGATILMSSDSNASIDLGVKVAADLVNLSLGDVPLGWRSLSEDHMSLSIVAEQSLTPLFRASAVRRSLFGRRLFRSLASKHRALERTVVFAECDYDDFD